MKKYLLIAALAFAVLIPVAGFLHFFMPRSMIVEMGEPYVRRMDNDGNLVGQGDRPSTATRDVFFVTTYKPGSDTPFVLRNEDTGWGFPWAFKFDSADLNAKASRMAKDKAIAKISYYGFRIEILSLFPNVLSIEPAQVGDSTFPWARIVILTMLALFIYAPIHFIRRLLKKRAA